ncbi:hypothetical protein [Sulfobacillus harzensis]|uniref:Uncharacterized protein n=1 Tax=Sulfobacillus harzensis TaxID=2729629 RepID=A0A7Y0L652_9FIRM|nr:hypothetical protein [Sulfobacillus harzensis]NMP23946.1 hypothetical protein [Sulfobacillus harzensis]
MTRSDRIRTFIEDDLQVFMPKFPLPNEQGVPVSGKVFGVEELVLAH